MSTIIESDKKIDLEENLLKSGSENDNSTNHDQGNVEGQESDESHLRSILKGFSWRIVATSTTIIVSYIVLHDISVALEIGSIEFIAKIIVYYIHERIWLKIPI